jgi:hypothetical protein
MGGWREKAEFQKKTSWLQSSSLSLLHFLQDPPHLTVQYSNFAMSSTAAATAPTANATAASPDRFVDHQGVRIIVPRSIPAADERAPMGLIATHQQEYEASLRELVTVAPVAGGNSLYVATREIGRLVVSDLNTHLGCDR